MATNEERKKANSLQQAMETQLVALEKLGALPPTAADEVRNIVAEGIADKFGEPYRTFLCAREGVEIRRDAVPKKCSLRESVEGFVASERSLEKTTKPKGRESQKKATNVAQPTTEKNLAASNALARASKPQRNLSLTIGHAARHNSTQARKTSSPEKQQPKASSSRYGPTKGGASQSMHQASLESGQKAWDVLLAQKAAENKTPAHNDDQRKLTAQGTGKPSAPITQGAGAGLRKAGRTPVAVTPNDGNGAHKGGMASQSVHTAENSGEGTALGTTPQKSVKPEEPSTDSSEDLIDLGS